jgi:O-acetylserine/cysteine efflux transporter
MKALDVCAAILVAMIWGLNVSVVKICVAEFPPVFVTGFRFLIVALLLIWWVRPPWEKMRKIGLLSFVFGGVHFGGIFFGLRGVDVSIVSILILIGVPFSVLFARVLLQERFSRKKIFGMCLAFVGVFILFGEPRTTASPLHLAVLVMATAAWGLGNTLIKEIGPINTFALNSWMGLFASLQLLLFSMVIEKGQLIALQSASANAWGALGYIVVMATIVGYGLWYYLIGKYDVTRVVPFTLLVPIAGVLGGVLIMGEALTLPKVLGGAVTLLGVALIQIQQCPQVLPMKNLSTK